MPLFEDQLFTFLLFFSSQCSHDLTLQKMHRLVTASTVVAVAASSAFIFQTLRQINSLPPDRITVSYDLSSSFQQSKAVSIVNPHQYPSSDDSRYTTISVPNSLSDEEIMARFVKGFFGGYVFTPERTALRLLGKTITKFNREYFFQFSFIKTFNMA